MGDMTKPAQRLKDYLARRQKARGLDLDFIHSFDSGPDGGFNCRASDIAAVLAMLDECERALNAASLHIPPRRYKATLAAVTKALAKLRGEQ